MNRPQLSRILSQLIGSQELIPVHFWECFSRPGLSAVYLVSCAHQERFLFISPSFRDLTGYQPSQFQQQSLPFWFSKISPQDIPRITHQITQAHQHLFSDEFKANRPNYFTLDYRFQRADGSWIWLEETKYIVSYTPQGEKDQILVYLRDITSIKDLQQRSLQQQAANHPLLRVATDFQIEDIRQPVSKDPILLSDKQIGLTKREKQVLALLASGLSTKAIAGQLFVSIHTIETHRRHLLEKFGVRNTAELIRQASQIYRL